MLLEGGKKRRVGGGGGGQKPFDAVPRSDPAGCHSNVCSAVDDAISVFCSPLNLAARFTCWSRGCCLFHRCARAAACLIGAQGLLHRVRDWLVWLGGWVADRSGWLAVWLVGWLLADCFVDWLVCWLGGSLAG